MAPQIHPERNGGYGARLMDVAAEDSVVIPRLELCCSDVVYTVKVKREQKSILNRISCRFPAGKLTGMVGPSGSGKTSLLSTLAGHLTNKRGVRLSGKLTVNDGPVPLNFKQLSCLIPQDDVLHAGLSPREALGFAAELRLSKPKAARQARVEQLIDELGLCDCADTRIGNVDRRGISGGQRKRVSVGLELVTDPAVILVDEATSGLDSKMAEDVISLLRKLAGTGRTVVCTIHQPSYRIFSSFDQLVMLARGRLCYAGPVDKASIRFQELSLALPQNENPADVYMRWLQDDAVLSRLIDSTLEPPATPTHADAEQQPKASRADAHYAVSRLRQFTILLRREFLDNLKDRDKFLKSLTLKVFIGFLVGVVWFQQAGDKQEDVFPVQGCLYVAVFNSVMDTIMATALELPRTRSILIREYRNGWYALPAHQLAVLVTLCALMTINTLGLAVPIYFLVGLGLTIMQFAIFVATLSLLSWIGVAFGLCIGAIANDLKQAQSAIAPTLVPLLLFSGYLIPYPQIPVYFQWLYHISFFQYAMAILEVNEFLGRTFEPCISKDAMERLHEQLPKQCEAEVLCIVAGASILSANTCFKDGEDLLRHKLHIDPDWMGIDYAILAGTFGICSVASYYLTRWVVRSH